MLYYGFATLGNKVLCREGYTNASGFLAHVREVKDELEGIIKQVGKERVKVQIRLSNQSACISKCILPDFMSWTKI